MDPRHKKYMDMTKAALVERVVQLLGQRDAAITDAEQADVRLKEATGRIDAHEKSYAALMESYWTEKFEHALLEGRHRLLEADLRNMTTDRDNWKHDYNVVLANYRRVKKDLYEQARLAGVLATEHDATLMNHERLS